MPSTTGRRALWYYKADITNCMRANADSYIEPKSKKRGLAEKYWRERSRLLLCERWWLPLQALSAVVLDAPAVGSRWVTCASLDGEHLTELAFCGFFNSSVGVLSRLAGRDNRKPSYPQFSLDTLRSTFVPDFSSDHDARQIVADSVRDLCNEVLLPLPQMNEDPVRIAIDEAVTAALGLDPEWVATIRRELSREPSVTNRRYAGG